MLASSDRPLWGIFFFIIIAFFSKERLVYTKKKKIWPLLGNFYFLGPVTVTALRFLNAEAMSFCPAPPNSGIKRLDAP
ncbi:hypothetical protein BC939DRAFT_446527 [Gamsiella multidivaricata]|uniref:uncharacterized protein n=1 Tax=Gamsiella multidivaricata TaxID=101098 RepID=UPI002220E56B|nr:uncharacterized protein BC939DRAFT_446527 [Gamsiella multidivaricata]KAI7826487.1 hypothetical protein BC939DRAFT_446527 [Gamsiella multidivaricata]